MTPPGVNGVPPTVPREPRNVWQKDLRRWLLAQIASPRPYPGSGGWPLPWPQAPFYQATSIPYTTHGTVFAVSFFHFSVLSGGPGQQGRETSSRFRFLLLPRNTADHEIALPIPGLQPFAAEICLQADLCQCRRELRLGGIEIGPAAVLSNGVQKVPVFCPHA